MKMKKKVKKNPLFREAVGDLNKTLSELHKIKNSMNRRITSLNNKLAKNALAKSKLRDKLAILASKERALSKEKSSFRSKSQRISKKIDKVNSLKNEIEGE